DEINEARDALGQAFGSKKRKAEIRNSERNKINLAKIEGSALVIGANIEARTMDMPTKEEINNEEALSRPVPKHDLNATEPHKIYDLNDVLSPEDAALLPISNIIDAKGPKDRLKYLPANSWFVSSKLDAELQKTKKDRRKLRQLVYLSYLIKFRTLKSNLLSRRSTVRKIFKDPPAALLDNLYSKYTEPVAGEVDAQGNP
ncbi:DNA-directed RNA polymerase I subunit rpa49, partial [Spiromyces aspiralis]